MDEMKLTNKVANLLWEAENNKQAIEPITETYPQLEVDHAYEIQLINIKRKLTTGRVVQGHKVGLSSKAMQKMMNVNEPDYGHLLDDFFHKNRSKISSCTRLYCGRCPQLNRIHSTSN